MTLTFRYKGGGMPLHLKQYKYGKKGKRSFVGWHSCRDHPDLDRLVIDVEPTRSIYFRSKMEANWARYLEWRRQHGDISNWLYEPCRFWFPFPSGNNFYLPDFLVICQVGNAPLSWWIDEVKGHMDAASKTKLNRLKQFYPSVYKRLRLVRWSNYRDVETKMGPIIDGWEPPESRQAADVKY